MASAADEAFDHLIAEYLMAAQSDAVQTDEYWIARAGDRAADMRAFLDDQR
jgi:hypothetical protein